MRSSWIFIACAACSSAPAASTPAVTKTPAAIDAGAAAEPAPAPIDAAPAAPSDEQFEVVIDEPYTTRDGLIVTLHSGGHKHAMGGGASSRFELTIAKGDDVHELSYSFSYGDAAWYIEGIAHGHVFTVESLFDVDDAREILTEPSDIDKNRRRLVTLIPTDRAPLNDDAAAAAAWDIAQATVEQRGCDGSSRSSSHTGGAYEFTVSDGGEVKCQLVVGVYSGHVIYVAP